MVDVSLLPVPPPWSEVSNEGGLDGAKGEESMLRYVNDITGEVSYEHPLLRLQRRQDEKRKQQHQDEEEGVEIDQREHTAEMGVTSVSNEQEAQGFSMVDENIIASQPSPIPEVDQGDDVLDEKGEYSDFNCKWKECTIGSKDRYYTLILRYFHDSSRVAVKFTGISGNWKYSVLEGKYGPISRYDLFIGSQIILFGRHLTIKTTTADVCHWLDGEAKLLEKQCLWLQDKISSSGYVPVVRKEAPVQLRHVDRISSTTGTKNLRKIHIQVCKLREQLCDVGLDHFAAMMPKHKALKSH